jgi:hypothetical protein
MRWFFRWLWRLNSILIALVCLFALIGLGVAVGSSMSVGLFSPRGAAHTSQSTQSNLVIVQGAAGPRAFLAALFDSTAPQFGDPSWRPEGAQNLILFDRDSNRGRRVFPDDDGRVARLISFDAACGSEREHHLYAAVLSSIVVSVSDAQFAPGQAAQPVVGQVAAALGVWRPSSGARRLMLIDFTNGTSRELASDVGDIQAIEPGAGGRCVVFISVSSALRAIEFGLGGDTAVEDQDLTYD